MFKRRSAGITILSARAEKAGPATGQAGPSARDETLFGFEPLSAALQEALAPMRPSAAFRQALARDLIALARQKQSPRIILQRPNHHRGILIGAAVSSAVSVAGLVALLWHHRGRQAVPRAS